MAKFIYRMQSILNVKEKLETQAKNEFAEAKIRLDEEMAVLEALEARKASYEEEGRRLREEELEVRKLNENQYAVDRMDEYIAEQKKNVAKAEKDLERARIKMVEAMQESQIHQKLRERAFEEFKRDLIAQESKEIDELTSFTYGQKKDE